MRVLVQNCVTRKFLGEGCIWLNSQAEAKAFRTGADAVDFCFTHDLEDVQVVLHFDSAAHLDIQLPQIGSGRQRP